MPRFAIAERREGMKFHAAGQFKEFNTLKDTETVNKINLIQRFGDTWKIIQYVDDDNLPHKIVHPGTSNGKA